MVYRGRFGPRIIEPAPASAAYIQGPTQLHQDPEQGRPSWKYIAANAIGHKGQASPIIGWLWQGLSSWQVAEYLAHHCTQLLELLLYYTNYWQEKQLRDQGAKGVDVDGIIIRCNPAILSQLKQDWSNSEQSLDLKVFYFQDCHALK